MIHYIDLVSDTICSPITASGHAGVAVIRVSGDKAWEITSQFVKPQTKPQSHQVFLSDFKTTGGNFLDQVLITYFEKGKSFSGDETVEIACHGNPFIVNAISEAYLNKGCRMAKPGEFSFRAFYNGRMDLVQAESVHQVVTNKTPEASEISLDHLKGGLSEIFKDLENRIVSLMGHLEASIDFVEQDVVFDENPQLIKKVDEILEINFQLLSSYESGKYLEDSPRITIVGPVNVGKSSLFNKFLGEKRAIVTDQAGTTRDLVRGETFFGNHRLEFFDSAGIRQSTDKVERIGVKKALEALDKAALILCVIDKLEDLKEDFIKQLAMDRSFLIFNKIDLLGSKQEQKLFTEILSMNSGFSKERIFLISALKNMNLEKLKEKMDEFISFRNKGEEQTMVTQARHVHHLLVVQKNLEMTKRLLENEQSPDLISQELSFGLLQIHQLLGKDYNDEVLDQIFSEFCIGK